MALSISNQIFVCHAHSISKHIGGKSVNYDGYAWLPPVNEAIGLY